MPTLPSRTGPPPMLLMEVHGSGFETRIDVVHGGPGYRLLVVPSRQNPGALTPPMASDPFSLMCFPESSFDVDPRLVFHTDLVLPGRSGLSLRSPSGTEWALWDTLPAGGSLFNVQRSRRFSGFLRRGRDRGVTVSVCEGPSSPLFPP